MLKRLMRADAADFVESHRGTVRALSPPHEAKLPPGAHAVLIYTSTHALILAHIPMMTLYWFSGTLSDTCYPSHIYVQKCTSLDSGCRV